MDISLDAGMVTEEVRPSRVRPLRILWPFFSRYRGRLFLALLFLIVSTVASLAVPLAIGNFIERGVIAHSTADASVWACWLLGIAAVIAIGTGARFYFIASLAESILVDLRQEVFVHLLQQEAAFYDRHRVGELTSRLGSDVAAIRVVIGSTLTVVVRAGITVAGALAMMLVLDAPLALAIMVGCPLLVAPVLLLTRRLRKMARRAQDAIAELAALATEMLGANRTVKSFTQEPELARKYSAGGARSLAAENSRLARRAQVIATVLMTAAGALVAVVSLATRAVLSNEMTGGQLAQFLVYALMAASAVSGVAEVAGSLQTVAGAAERLAEVLTLRPLIVAPPKPLPMCRPPVGTIEFVGVCFRYAASERPALAQVSFEIRAGRTYALVGPSGAGKSTIFSLVQRLYDVEAGTIRVDGLDVRHVDPGELRRRIAAVEQDPVLFSGTIADNLRFGRSGASDDEIIRAADLALVNEFARAMPRGLDTLVGERGIRLSGGQRQRIAIARAIVKDAPILLLDEATSALDAVNEQLVRDALARLREGRTTMVIAHRLSTIHDADEILVLDKGSIVGRGTHDALFASSVVYRDLVRLQTAV